MPAAVSCRPSGRQLLSLLGRAGRSLSRRFFRPLRLQLTRSRETGRIALRVLPSEMDVSRETRKTAPPAQRSNPKQSTVHTAQNPAAQQNTVSRETPKKQTSQNSPKKPNAKTAEILCPTVALNGEIYYNNSGKNSPLEGVCVAKRIVIANQKGGVGKTTTAVNLTAALKELGKRVLLCDFDPQANATSGLGVDKNAVSPSVYDVLIDGADPKKAVVSTQWGDVLPSNKALAGAGIEMIGLDDREMLLRKALDQLDGDYDYIVIDCPPSLELLTLNGLCAAHSIIVPVQCEYYALEGLSDLLSTIRIVKRKLNRSIELEGVLLTMFDGRTNLSLQVAEEVKRHFPGQVYATVIPRNVRLSEAPSHGKPVMAYDKYSTGAQAYQKLAEEFLSQNS